MYENLEKAGHLIVTDKPEVVLNAISQSYKTTAETNKALSFYENRQIERQSQRKIDSVDLKEDGEQEDTEKNDEEDLLDQEEEQEEE